VDWDRLGGVLAEREDTRDFASMREEIWEVDFEGG
jgi:hypothetical protein